MQAKEEVLLGEMKSGTKHIVMGKNQPEYLPLHCDVIDRGNCRIAVARFSLTDEERLKIASGADIVHQVIIGDMYPPMNLQVCAVDENPAIVRS